MGLGVLPQHDMHYSIPKRASEVDADAFLCMFLCFHSMMYYFELVISFPGVSKTFLLTGIIRCGLFLLQDDSLISVGKHRRAFRNVIGRSSRIQLIRISVSHKYFA